MTTPVQLHHRYRTRNGLLATITATDRGGLRPVRAEVAIPAGHYGNEQPLTDIRFYTPAGRVHQPLGGEPQEDSPYDLITEA